MSGSVLGSYNISEQQTKIHGAYILDSDSSVAFLASLLRLRACVHVCVLCWGHCGFTLLIIPNGLLEPVLKEKGSAPNLRVW